MWDSCCTWLPVWEWSRLWRAQPTQWECQGSWTKGFLLSQSNHRCNQAEFQSMFRWQRLSDILGHSNSKCRRHSCPSWPLCILQWAWDKVLWVLSVGITKTGVGKDGHNKLILDFVQQFIGEVISHDLDGDGRSAHQTTSVIRNIRQAKFAISCHLEDKAGNSDCDAFKKWLLFHCEHLHPRSSIAARASVLLEGILFQWLEQNQERHSHYHRLDNFGNESGGRHLFCWLPFLAIWRIDGLNKHQLLIPGRSDTVWGNFPAVPSH